MSTVVEYRLIDVIVLAGLPGRHPSHPRGQESQRVEGDDLFLAVVQATIEERGGSRLCVGDETMMRREFLNLINLSDASE